LIPLRASLLSKDKTFAMEFEEPTLEKVLL
jgi:ABC-type transport system involved in cytochrome c biogenesis permease component